MAIGVTEILIVLVIILILFGPKKLPELAKGLEKSSQELKKTKKPPTTVVSNDNDDQD